jgi:multidrug resistance efflux pump
MLEKKPVFRQVALERLSSPEQLDQLMQVTTPKGWLALLAVGGLLLAALVWSIFGSLPTQVPGQGILLGGGGVNTVFASSEGQIKRIHVKVGDMVRRGQLIARLEPTNPDDSSRVNSPTAGRVLEIRVSEGNVVVEGAPIVSLEPTELQTGGMTAIVYLPATEGKKIRPGMAVQVSPSTVKREEYGFIQGQVTSVGEFPASQQGMLRVLGSEELVGQFAAIGAPIEVRVTLLPEPGSSSGYKWSAKGPDITIANGTLCSVQIVLERKRPLSLVLPILKETLGVY